jgi:acetolactate synthase-1/2/3 large subunit
MGGKPAIASDHANFVGIIGRYSSIAANSLVENADCVLALGTRLGGLATNGWRLPAPDATVLQIDQDPTAFINPYYPEVGVVADLRQALSALTAATDSETNKHNRGGTWLAHGQAMAAQWREELHAQTLAVHDATPLSPLTVLAALRPYARDCTLVADTGYMAAWTGALFPVERPNAFFRAAGSLGWALPASLGVQLARPEKVVCVSGDGGLGYHLADIETAVRYRLPVVILVLNNDCLAFEYHEQKYRWNGDVIAQANDFTRVDYARVAEALGASARRVETREALVDALAVAMQASGPYLIDIAIDREAYPPVTNFEAHLRRAL